LPRIPSIERTRRSVDPAIRRSGDPAIRRSGDPEIRRSGDPAIRIDLAAGGITHVIGAGSLLPRARRALSRRFVCVRARDYRRHGFSAACVSNVWCSVRSKTYRWPGNARELRNVVDRIALLIDGDCRVTSSRRARCSAARELPTVRASSGACGRANSDASAWTTAPSFGAPGITPTGPDERERCDAMNRRPGNQHDRLVSSDPRSAFLVEDSGSHT